MIRCSNAEQLLHNIHPVFCYLAVFLPIKIISNKNGMLLYPVFVGNDKKPLNPRDPGLYGQFKRGFSGLSLPVP